jgi:hypothetical protein
MDTNPGGNEMAGIDTLIELADKFGIIEAVKAKLVARPDPAADKLAAVLEELSKIYGAIESEITTYLAVSFDESQPATEQQHEREALIALEGGKIRSRMAEARGHCEKIMNIYNRFLTPWFTTLLNAQELQKIHELFELLAGADGFMLAAIEEVATWLSQEATEVLDLVDDGKVGEANQRIRKARKTILPQRRSISDAMRLLHNIEAEFIGVSGAIGS